MVAAGPGPSCASIWDGSKLMTIEVQEMSEYNPDFPSAPRWRGKVCGPGARWQTGRSIEEVIGTLFRRYAYKFYADTDGYKTKVDFLNGYSETSDAIGRVIERGNCKTHLQIAPKEKI